MASPSVSQIIALIQTAPSPMVQTLKNKPKVIPKKNGPYTLKADPIPKPKTQLTLEQKKKKN